MGIASPIGNKTQEYCSDKYKDFQRPKGELWCEPVWDTLLCWPPAKASTTIQQKCPLQDVFDATKLVEKKCGYNGQWEGRNGTSYEDSQGWANYTTCFTPEMYMLHEKVYTNTVDGDMKLEIAEKTRMLEFVGLSTSLVALLISLAIFCRFRSLRNTRTRIHKNLFCAMVVQVAIRLILYIDIEILRKKPYGIEHGIGNTPVLCEISYTFLEYIKTAMFMWMFIEGLFLHNMLTVTVFQENSHYGIYWFIGWGCPVLMTLIWATVTTLYYHPKAKFPRCWSGYNLSSYFWILEGPRFAVITINLLFLLNIIRVLVIKLRQTHTSELKQLGKAVRAALVLLPLLGITNVLFMVEVPLHNVKKFALWSYSAYFFQSFQGLFISIIYCFSNGEVRLALNKAISVYLSLRATDLQARRKTKLKVSKAKKVATVIEMEEGQMGPSGWMRQSFRGGSAPPADRPAETAV